MTTICKFIWIFFVFISRIVTIGYKTNNNLDQQRMKERKLKFYQAIRTNKNPKQEIKVRYDEIYNPDNNEN